MAGLPDDAARLQAATDFERNLVVTAGAGTGKTSLLVERILTAIGSGRARIDELAAITFTEKAAAELRQRLAEGLEELPRAGRGAMPAEDRPAGKAFRHLRERFGVPLETITERCLAALEALEQAEVATIHGFCANLLRAHPLEARVDPDFRVDPGEVAERVFEETWEAFLARELGPEAARGSLWRALLDEFDLEALEELARALASFDIPQELLGAPPAAADLASWLGPILRELDEDLERYGRIASGGRADWAAATRKILHAVASGRLHEMDREEAAKLRERMPSEGELKRALPPARAARSRALVRILLQHLAALDDRLLAQAVELVAPCAGEAREALLREGFLSFDALLALARDLLRDWPDVRRLLKKRFSMLLVDEFQDTDPLQYEIVLFLAEREEDAARDPFRARLEPGKLFVVGDPKQSIYRFRGADYAAYRRAVQRVLDEGGQELVLRANFRSVPEVLEPINRLFQANPLWVASPCQPRYERIEAARPPAGAPRVEIWTLSLERETHADERRKAEGRVVARAIRELTDRGACEAKDITILLRAFSELQDYVAPLRRSGVPFIVDGGREFYERPEVRELLAVLRAVALPEDPVALLAFLRSPCGGVSDEELARYALEGGHWSLGAPPDPGKFPALAGALGLLKTLHDRARVLPADEIVWMILRETELLALNAAPYEGAQRVANLEKLASQAAELGRSGQLGLLEIVELLREGRTGEAEAESPLADENVNAVRVMTIHKAKGLENRIVFVPDLARSAQHRREGAPVRVLTASDGTPHLALAIGGRFNQARAAWECEEYLHDAAEELRVLYVAFTRARERLILLAGPGSNRAPHPYLELLSQWGYELDEAPEDGATLCGGLVLHRLQEPAEPPRAERDVPPLAQAAVDRWEADVERARAAPPPLVAASDEELWRDREIAARRSAKGSETARAVGVAVHRLLERWDLRDEGALRAAVSRAVAELEDLDPAERRCVQREVMARIEAFLRSELCDRLRRSDIVGREVPLLLHDEGGRSFRGSLDLLYRDEDGAYAIADYKTDQGVSEEALLERYRPQLQVYGRAVQRALGLAALPRLELWHLAPEGAQRLLLD